jgi:hypothetical protein
MRGYQVVLLCVAIPFTRPSLARAVDAPPEKQPIAAVAVPLESIEFVEAKALSKDGRVLTPRDDCRIHLFVQP